jgi:hypothetical protein
VWQKNWTSGKFLKILMWKHSECVKHSLCCEIFMLLRWEILLCGKCIKRARYVLVILEGFGTRFFLYFRWENFFSGYSLSRLHCKFYLSVFWWTLQN